MYVDLILILLNTMQFIVAPHGVSSVRSQKDILPVILVLVCVKQQVFQIVVCKTVIKCDLTTFLIPEVVFKYHL